jgi:hypothetical protein
VLTRRRNTVSEDTKKFEKSERATTELSEQDLNKVAGGTGQPQTLLVPAAPSASGKEVVVERITLTSAEITGFEAGR